MEQRSFKFTTRQGISYVAMFVIGSTLFTQGALSAKQDTWISALIAFGMALPVLFIYARILALFPGMSLYDIFYKLFGKFGGAVLTVVYIIFFLHMEVLIVQMFTQFNRLYSLPTTPLFMIALPICILGSWLASLGYLKLGKTAGTMLILVVFALLFTFFASITAFGLTNFMPMFEAEPSVIADSALDYFGIPLTQTAVFLCILSNMDSAKGQRRSFVWGVVIGAFFIVLSLLRSAFVLGGEALGKLNHTSYLAASVIRIDSFIQRIEAIISLAFLIATLMKISAYCFAAKEGVMRVFPKIKASWLIFPTAIGVAVVASQVLRTSEVAFAWVKFASRYSLVLQVAVPVIVWIWGEIAAVVVRLRKQN